MSGVQPEPGIGASRRKADLLFVVERGTGGDVMVIVETNRRRTRHTVFTTARANWRSRPRQRWPETER